MTPAVHNQDKTPKTVLSKYNQDNTPKTVLSKKLLRLHDKTPFTPLSPAMLNKRTLEFSPKTNEHGEKEAPQSYTELPPPSSSSTERKEAKPLQPVCDCDQRQTAGGGTPEQQYAKTLHSAIFNNLAQESVFTALLKDEKRARSKMFALIRKGRGKTGASASAVQTCVECAAGWDTQGRGSCGHYYRYHTQKYMGAKFQNDNQDGFSSDDEDEEMREGYTCLLRSYGHADYTDVCEDGHKIESSLVPAEERSQRWGRCANPWWLSIAGSIAAVALLHARTGEEKLFPPALQDQFDKLFSSFVTQRRTGKVAVLHLSGLRSLLSQVCLLHKTSGNDASMPYIEKLLLRMIHFDTPLDAARMIHESLVCMQSQCPFIWRTHTLPHLYPILRSLLTCSLTTGSSMLTQRPLLHAVENLLVESQTVTEKQIEQRTKPLRKQGKITTHPSSSSHAEFPPLVLWPQANAARKSSIICDKQLFGVNRGASRVPTLPECTDSLKKLQYMCAQAPDDSQLHGFQDVVRICTSRTEQQQRKQTLLLMIFCRNRSLLRGKHVERREDTDNRLLSTLFYGTESAQSQDNGKVKPQEEKRDVERKKSIHSANKERRRRSVRVTSNTDSRDVSFPNYTADTESSDTLKEEKSGNSTLFDISPVFLLDTSTAFLATERIQTVVNFFR